MSDGPHRTLAMRPAWKELSKRADKDSFSAAEVAETVCPALAADWKGEMPGSVLAQVRAALSGDATDWLFADQTARDLIALRDMAPSPLAGLFIDCTSQALADGLRGEDACVAGAEAALRERAGCGARQVEEHYRRRVADTRTDNVRSRLDTASSSAPIGALARKLLTGQSGAVGRMPAKRTGIEEGPSL